MKSLSAGLVNQSARDPDFLELRNVLFDKQFTPFFGPVLTPVPVSQITVDFSVAQPLNYRSPTSKQAK